MTPDDVHLIRMDSADLGAINLFAWPRCARLRVERPQRLVGQTHRVGIDACWAANAAVTATARSRVRAGCSRRSARARPICRRVAIAQALDVRAPVALELRFNPIDGGAIAIGALSTITKARECFDGDLIAREIEPGDQAGNRIDRRDSGRLLRGR